MAGYPIVIAAQTLPDTPTANAATAVHNPHGHLTPISPPVTPTVNQSGGNNRNLSTPITKPNGIQYQSKEVAAYIRSLASQIPNQVTLPFFLKAFLERKAAAYQLQFQDRHYGMQGPPALDVTSPPQIGSLDYDWKAPDQTARAKANAQQVTNQVLLMRYQTNTAIALHENGTEPNSPLIAPYATSSDLG